MNANYHDLRTAKKQLWVGQVAEKLRKHATKMAKKPKIEEFRKADSHQALWTEGTVVWGKLGSFLFWPALVVSPSTIGMKVDDAHAWYLYWFGDRKVSPMKKCRTLSFVENFESLFAHGKGRKLFRCAILDALKICLERAELDIADDEKAIEWASSGFNGFKEEIERGSLSKELLQMCRQVVGNEHDGDRREIDHEMREQHITLLKEKKIQSSDFCICCGSNKNITREHLLFCAGICDDCLSCYCDVFIVGEDGTSYFCHLCCDGGDLVLCSRMGCFRTFCQQCITLLLGKKSWEKICSLDNWECLFCTQGQVGKTCVLRPALDAAHRILTHFPSAASAYPSPLPSIGDHRPGIHVLSLFDGIATVYCALNMLKIKVDAYYSCEIDAEAMSLVRVQHPTCTMVGDIRKLSGRALTMLLPVDLVIGGSPCNDFSIANPNRKGLSGSSGQLFYEFPRVLREVQSNNGRPFFWMYENVASMKKEIKNTISRHLGCQPVTWDAENISSQRRCRHFWGNLPCMMQVPSCYFNKSTELNSFLRTGRQAKGEVVRTITTQKNSLGKPNIMPVNICHGLDYLWISEIERIFGLPQHYTDVNNLSITSRRRLLGKAFSVQVLVRLFTPLRDYFISSAV